MKSRKLISLSDEDANDVDLAGDDDDYDEIHFSLL